MFPLLFPDTCPLHPTTSKAPACPEGDCWKKAGGLDLGVGEEGGTGHHDEVLQGNDESIERGYCSSQWGWDVCTVTSLVGQDSSSAVRKKRQE
ncbi:hypothetical protein J4Q44_G00339640 [Coregonus suidteri]|uniref:Uncharacterized protein n=1 Tax=Coregonus suidteri TaxID=861788 RepID=A0AAN8KWR2_9TELE